VIGQAAVFADITPCNVVDKHAGSCVPDYTIRQ